MVFLEWSTGPLVKASSQTALGYLVMPTQSNCIFSAGEGGFGQMMYRSPELSPQDSRDGIFCTVPRPHFLGRALIWPGCFGERILGLFGLYSSSLSKSVGFVSLSGKASLVSISVAILFLRSWHVYFPLEFEVRGKSCVKWEHTIIVYSILLLYIEWIWTNYCKLSRNLVGAIRTTTINCRVSFIDLYSVFPRNFRMVFLPNTNTVILLEPCLLWYYHRAWVTCAETKSLSQET